MHEQSKHITLTEAAKITPGRPSTNCLWRWCRRGVLSRSGERIRLEHVRIGGKIFTTAQWVEQFGKALAEADASYFDLEEQSTEAPTPHSRTCPRTQRRRPTSRHIQRRQSAHDQANRELEEAGL
jgi:hypothetical protein